MTSANPYDYDVFISYNHADRRLVELLTDAFEKLDVRVFRDTTELALYDKLDAKLKDAVARSEKLIAVVSPAYLRSYWCLFEAIEAIQGEEFDQRFFPVLVKYHPNDQAFDEDFVLDALQSLDEQIREFEARMVTAHAYELAPRLEKLSFVRNHLPKIHRHVYEKLFPELHLWDPTAARSTLDKLFSSFGPASALDWVEADLEFGRSGSPEVVVPALDPLPRIVWAARVGHQAWKNRPAVAGDSLVVGGCGSTWNTSDERDGVTCLDVRTGKERWFSPTPSDANAVVISRGLVVSGTDTGSVHAWALESGNQEWESSLGSGIVGGPIKLPGDIADWNQRGLRDPVLLTTWDGSLVLLDLITGEELERLDLGIDTLAAPAVVSEGTGHRIIIVLAHKHGQVSAVEYDSIWISLKRLWTTEVRYQSEYSKTGEETPSFSATPIVIGSRVIVGLVRNTYYSPPPFTCLHLHDGSHIWDASVPAEDTKKYGFGNVRGTPSLHGKNSIIFSTAYTDVVGMLDASTGLLEGAIEVGATLFEQWSSPVVVGDSTFIGRHDGYLHKVSLSKLRREWSIFLGSKTRAGMAVDGTQTLPEFSSPGVWKAAGSAPILSTPTYDRQRIYVGTAEGWLYCLGGLGISRATRT